VNMCYSTGAVSGNERVGGLVGYRKGGSITLSFWDTQTSGQTTSDGGTGKTTAQMKRASTFAGWDFRIIWTIEEGVDYPRFRVQGEYGGDIVTMEDFETGDFSKFSWEQYGDETWTVTSGEKYSGNYSAEAGLIDYDQSTTLQITLICESRNITFYRKVSSESGFDHLTFYIDGVEQDRWSGEEDWAQVSFPVTAGKRTFEWTYSKDSAASEGLDTAWIDDIWLFPPPPGVIELTDANFDQIVISSDVPVLVFFYADWCPYSEMQAPIIEKIADEYAYRAKICKINFDENRNTVRRFGVYAIPTLILFKDGQVKKTWVGLTDKRQLTNAIDKLL